MLMRKRTLGADLTRHSGWLELDITSAHNRKDQGKHDKPHDQTHQGDDRRLDENQHPFDRILESLIEHLVNLKKDLLQVAASLADHDHVGDDRGEKGDLPEDRRYFLSFSDLSHGGFD